MKIKEYKNKIVLAELNPDADYIMLVNPSLVDFNQLKNLETKGSRIYFLLVDDVDKAIKFVEIPK